MLGTFVRKWSSTSTRPALSVSMPSSSRPRPAVKGRRPVDTRTTSKTSVVSSPPLAGACVSATPSSVTSALTTPVLSLNFMPCFLSSRRNVLPVSLSVPGTMWSRYSTTVTLVPSRRQTLPISRPMTPPPTTAMVSGILSSTRAPVESTILPAALSTGQGASGDGSEPVAMRMFLVSTVSAPPSFMATCTELGPVILPWPWR
mmetsp:Transcript_5683/g.16779  ORF Transcript_5683/g.16779 Transcript_5683/m.16779 type:complete len:202 (-) Transcript_5683:493-1098(-)